MTRGRALAVGAALLALVAAFVAGRFSAPLKVDTVEVEKVVYRDRVVEVKAKAETKVVYRDRVVTKEGETRERVVERTDAKTDEAKTVDRVGAVEKVVEKTVTLRPDWRVGVLAGASLREPLVPIAGPLVLGVTLERRIVGGFSAGAWVNTVGAAGVSLSLEF